MPNETIVGTQQDTAWNVAFLQLRARLTTSLQPIQPYSLPICSEDHHYTPKPKHLRRSRLLRVLGSSFNPFWMSIDQPPDVSGVLSSEVRLDSDAHPVPHGDTQQAAHLPNYTTFKDGLNISASPDLTESITVYQRKLEKEAEDLDLSSLPLDTARLVRDFLVLRSTCSLRYQWVDLGPVFWPRWVRHTDCEKPDGSRSCSFPRGMICVRAQTTQLKMLAWHCWGSKDRGGGLSRTAVGPDSSTEMGAGEVDRKCMWRQVQYPVVTACKCSCK